MRRSALELATACDSVFMREVVRRIRHEFRFVGYTLFQNWRLRCCGERLSAKYVVGEVRIYIYNDLLQNTGTPAPVRMTISEVIAASGKHVSIFIIG